MERFYGKVGYADVIEQPAGSGIWIDQITEFNYYGDVVKLRSSWQNANQANDNLRIGNSISIIADAYAMKNFSKIKYVEWQGAKWKVESVEPARPRLILTLGGVYNGG